MRWFNKTRSRLSLRLGHKQLPRRTAREGASLTERRAAHRARRERRRRAHGAARQPSARLAHRHQQHAAVLPVHRSPAPRTAHPNHPWRPNSPLSAVWRHTGAVPLDGPLTFCRSSSTRSTSPGSSLQPARCPARNHCAAARADPLQYLFVRPRPFAAAARLTAPSFSYLYIIPTMNTTKLRSLAAVAG